MKFDEFYEQARTLVHVQPETVTLLENLHDVRLTKDQALGLAGVLVEQFELPKVQIEFNGWTDRGIYWSHSSLIRVRSSHISTEVLCHELAHHWTYAKMEGVADRTHGYDFAVRLERLAYAAAQEIEEAIATTE